MTSKNPNRRLEAVCAICGKKIFRLESWASEEWHHVESRRYYCYLYGGDKPVLNEYVRPQRGTERAADG